MFTRLLAGVVVALVASAHANAAEDDARNVIVLAAESSDNKPLDWDDADARTDKTKQSAGTGAAKSEDAKFEGAKSAPAAASDTPKRDEGEKAAESAKPVESAKPAVSDKPSEPAKAAEAAKPAEPAREAKPDAPNRAEAKPATSVARDPESAKSAARPARQTASEASTRTRAARSSRDGAEEVAATRASIRDRAGRERDERAWTPSEDDRRMGRREASEAARRPAVRTAQATRRPEPMAPPPLAQEVASRQSTPISGGILCGGGSKWRCNWLEREHNKFYKFTPGHNWTDQSMATDFCATERQMRVASVNRVKSTDAGCCGFVVLQVTCRR